MTLYEIDKNIQNIIDSIYESVDENGEVGEVDFDALRQLQEDRKNKLENIALYIKNLEAEAGAIRAEEENLANRRKRLERKSEGLRGLLINSMNENNEPSFSTARCSLKIRSSERTEIIDINNIPDIYIREKIERTPDKKAIKEALKSGEVMEGAKIVINQTIRIE